MHVYFHLFGLNIPAYGTMIATGVLLANLIAYFLIKRDGKTFDDLLLVEAYAILGGFVGAKLLYILVSIPSIDFRRLGDLSYVNDLIRGGFVFYGGLIGGVLGILIGKKIHHYDVAYFAKRIVFLVPFCHAFGRIGCFMAGCCYGVEYHGPCHVVFPEDSFAIPGVPLFPIQMVEAICLFLISLLLFILMVKFHSRFTVEIYIAVYACLRFVLEKYRFDADRGIYFGLSTSQWISILLLTGAAVSVIVRKRRLASVPAVEPVKEADNEEPKKEDPA